MSPRTTCISGSIIHYTQRQELSVGDYMDKVKITPPVSYTSSGPVSSCQRSSISHLMSLLGVSAFSYFEMFFLHGKTLMYILKNKASHLLVWFVSLWWINHTYSLLELAAPKTQYFHLELYTSLMLSKACSPSVHFLLFKHNSLHKCNFHVDQCRLTKRSVYPLVTDEIFCHLHQVKFDK